MMKKMTLWLFVCMSIVTGLWSSCSDNNDYEIYSTLYGTVTDNETGEALENVMVILSPSNNTQQTKANGTFRFEGLDVQSYTVIAQKAGYQPNRKNVSTISGEEMKVDISLTLIEKLQ